MRLTWRGLHALRKKGSPHRGLLIEAAAQLALARLMLLALPFQHVARRLGQMVAPDTARAPSMPAASAEASRRAREVGWAVRRAAAVVPFKAACLQQGIAAKRMLRRRGIGSVLHFGVARSAGAIQAHAWLDAAGTEVTGYPVGHEFSELVCFR